MRRLERPHQHAVRAADTHQHRRWRARRQGTHPLRAPRRRALQPTGGAFDARPGVARRDRSRQPATGPGTVDAVRATGRQAPQGAPYRANVPTSGQVAGPNGPGRRWPLIVGATLTIAVRVAVALVATRDAHPAQRPAPQALPPAPIPPDPGGNTGASAAAPAAPVVVEALRVDVAKPSAASVELDAGVRSVPRAQAAPLDEQPGRGRPDRPMKLQRASRPSQRRLQINACSDLSPSVHH